VCLARCTIARRRAVAHQDVRKSTRDRVHDAFRGLSCRHAFGSLDAAASGVDRHRLPANDVLERRIEDLLTRPRGRPSHAPLVRYRSFHYQAASWKRPRRVIAKVEHHLGELFPRVGFIITTLTGTNRAVVRFYNRRGTAEQWIKEGKTATHWTRLSCHRFRANEVRLLLGVIAYNLGNLLRRLVLPVAIQDWSLTSLQQRLLKTGGRLIRHARYFILQLAESYLTGNLFRQILGRIERLAQHPT
jgi:Transposase DDE domain group 1